MTTQSLKKNIDQYFEDRFKEAGTVQFEDVAPKSRGGGLLAIAAGISLLLVVVIYWQQDTSILAAELLTTTRWHSSTNRYRDYQGRQVFYKLPTLGE